MSTVIAVFAEVCCLLSFLARQRLLLLVGWVVSFVAVFLKALLRRMALVALCTLNDEQKNERATLKFPLPKCIGNIVGYPEVFQDNSHPHPLVPIPMTHMGFWLKQVQKHDFWTRNEVLGDKHSKPCPILVELSMYWTALPSYVVYHLLLTYHTLLSSLLYQ